MGTGAVIARTQDDGQSWRGTLTLKGGDFTDVGRVLLSMFQDYDGDLESVWRTVSSPPVGWLRFMDEPIDEGAFVSELPRYSARGAEFAGPQYPLLERDIAVYYFMDLERRRFLYRGGEARTTASIDAAGRADFKRAEGLSPRENALTRRRSTYGTADVDRTARALERMLRRRLPISGGVGQRNVAVRLRWFIRPGARTSDAWGHFRPMAGCAEFMLQQTDAWGVSHEHVAIPRRWLLLGEELVGAIDGWLSALERALAEGDSATAFYLSPPLFTLDLASDTRSLFRALGQFVDSP